MFSMARLLAGKDEQLAAAILHVAKPLIKAGSGKLSKVLPYAKTVLSVTCNGMHCIPVMFGLRPAVWCKGHACPTLAFGDNMRR